MIRYTASFEDAGSLAIAIENPANVIVWNDGTVVQTTPNIDKQPDLIAIAVDFVDPATWFVAGHALADSGKRSFALEIKVTDETNTKAEKARYIREAYAAFAALLGDVHEESYIHVHDVRAAAYGYGGRTQEHRYQHPD